MYQDKHYIRQLNKVLDRYIKDLPLIAILRGITPGEVISVAEVLVDAGIVMIEVPLNSPDACTSIQVLAKRYQKKALIGAGTVLSVDEVIAVRKAGAGLVVSPNMNAAVIAETKRRNMVSVPGSFTPTEILAALASGADAVKLFPAEMIPPATVKAIRAVLPPRFPMIAVGGIHTENMKDYMQHGIDGFGIGSALYKPGKSLSEIRRDANSLISAYGYGTDRIT